MRMHHLAFRDADGLCAELCMHGAMGVHHAGLGAPVACAACRLDPAVDVYSFRPEAGDEWIAYGLCRACIADSPERVGRLVGLAITTGRLEVHAAHVDDDGKDGS